MDAHKEQYFTNTRPARLIAVANRINLQAADSERAFAAELERIVCMAVPHLAQDRPNLVALGEILGLPLALAGRRGYLPRLMHTYNVAILASLLYAHYCSRFLISCIVPLSPP